MKKIITLLLTTVTIMSLVACNNANINNSSSNNDINENTADTGENDILEDDSIHFIYDTSVLTDEFMNGINTHYTLKGKTNKETYYDRLGWMNYTPQGKLWCDQYSFITYGKAKGVNKEGIVQFKIELLEKDWIYHNGSYVNGEMDLYVLTNYMSFNKVELKQTNKPVDAKYYPQKEDINGWARYESTETSDELNGFHQIYLYKELVGEKNDKTYIELYFKNKDTHYSEFFTDEEMNNLINKFTKALSIEAIDEIPEDFTYNMYFDTKYYLKDNYSFTLSDNVQIKIPSNMTVTACQQSKVGGMKMNVFRIADYNSLELIEFVEKYEKYYDEELEDAIEKYGEDKVIRKSTNGIDWFAIVKTDSIFIYTKIGGNAYQILYTGYDKTTLERKTLKTFNEFTDYLFNNILVIQ